MSRRYPRKVVLSHSQKSCETCRFYRLGGCPVPSDPNQSTSNRWLAIEFLNGRKENPNLECLLWESRVVDAPS